ncbi:LPXTG cell wall anchor domain-containing protein [Lactococcus hircilactis]|uniref:LPXTG cell wall anchor domain-containing protein n=1 Tax=Lactococcus hircilactis TaxID=1494462 RepID=A0A7X2D160_9LACT|nr:LPXTG cell wall anchor domain-containing protein [Lactococcus hircilactis]
MKKIIVAVLLLFFVGHPPRADAQTTDTVTSTTTVTFIANPNLPKPPAPGLLSDSNPVKVTDSKGILPQTGENQVSFVPLGSSLILLAVLLYFYKEKGVTHTLLHQERKNT